MEDIGTLTRLRGRIKSRLTTFCNFIEKAQTIVEKRAEIPVRLEKLDETWKDFVAVQDRIEELNETEEQFTERSHFEDLYFSSLTAAKKLLHIAEPIPFDQPANIPPAQCAPAPVSIQLPSMTSVRLPSISLPRFNGDHEHWVSFKDLFTSLVHENLALSPVQKLHYLKASLSGEAAQALSSLDLTNDNYPVAWNLLNKRYENKRLIVQHHVQALFDVSSVHKESYSLLRQLVDDVTLRVQNLKKLEQPVEAWDTLLIHMLLPKVDKGSRREWESQRVTNTQFPTLNEFTDFLIQRSSFLEALAQTNSSHQTAVSNSVSVELKNNKAGKQLSHAYVTSEGSKCPTCSGNHNIYECPTFHKMQPNDRYQEAKSKKLCISCLRAYHGRNCRAPNCKKCHKYHHTLLHMNHMSNDKTSNDIHDAKQNRNVRIVPSESTTSESSHRVDESTPTTSYSHCATMAPAQVLLSTAVVLIKNKWGKYCPCKALLDCGSQSNFITRDLCDKLQLKKRNVSTTILSINEVPLPTTHQVSATFKSKHNSFNCTSPFVVLEKITDRLPTAKLDKQSFRIPSNIKLADPHYYVPSNIDLLIGASVFWDLLCIGQIKMAKGHPIFQKTQLGWIISGPVPNMKLSKSTATSHCYFTSQIRIQQQLEKFWQVEEIQAPPHFSPEEQACENHFTGTHKRDENGRFVVTLPFKSSNDLGDSKLTAQRRYLSMERKLERQPELKEHYHAFMREYLELDHMVEVKEEVQPQSLKYYIPHHAVTKDSTTTKVRVVFDASCPTSTGKSLNDLLMVGPTIQEELFSIVTRFRQSKYVMTADIAKMYRQIQLNKTQQDLQRILWRWSSNEPIRIYQLKTVTYGMSSSPFLAIRCLHEIAKIHQNEYPEASHIILRDFYVDDLLTGHNDVNQLIRRKEEISNILAKAKFELRKWKSNVTELHDDCSNDSSTVPLGEITKTLGLLWQPSTDTLQYRAKTPTPDKRVTKRSILSNISQIYDPLGLLGPVIVQTKLLLQQLWRLNTGWDESVPLSVHTTWTSWLDQVHHLNRITIPRHAITDNPINIELHGFSDASEVAYGACVYIRSTSDHNTYTVRLLCAKSRVAPLKQITLPRLELCGAVLLANLCNTVLKALTVSINNVYYWCDSTITLAWIQGEPYQWTTFVANRVAEIQRLTDKQAWRHIRSETNPADVLSRGINPEELIQHSLWWSGPPILHQNSNLDDSSLKEQQINPPETRRLAMTFVNTEQPWAGNEIITRISSLTRLTRVVAYCLRFKFNCSNPTAKLKGSLSVTELTDALNTLLQTAQRSEFRQEWQYMKKGQRLPSTSKLLNLNPFLDNCGLIRVGGRLHNAPIDYSQKHPILLPSKHYLTELIIRHEHYSNLHAGPQGILASIRLKYWPLSGRSAVKRVLRKCIVCFRTRPTIPAQLMGNLPSDRVTPGRAFLNSGVDYAGPFSIKLSRNKTAKAYLCVFVCFSTKAIHLELVSNLTTDAFLNALKRFFARRGKCSNLYSDHGTNFVGANNVLLELKTFLKDPKTQTTINSYLTNQFINWKFIPPYSPHVGGLWESAVKSAKSHLRKVLGSQPLYFEELTTVITQIESCLNSRPITPMSDDPNDLSVLTPGHFLIGEPLTAIPERDIRDVPSNRLSRYQLLEYMRQHFWTRWSHEYVSQLQQRYKWKQTTSDFKVGTMVLLRNENTSPLNWPLGRITDTHPGKDGLIRIVSIRTQTGLCQRSIAKLCILPIEDNDNV